MTPHAAVLFCRPQPKAPSRVSWGQPGRQMSDIGSQWSVLVSAAWIHALMLQAPLFPARHINLLAQNPRPARRSHKRTSQRCLARVAGENQIATTHNTAAAAPASASLASAARDEAAAAMGSGGSGSGGDAPRGASQRPRASHHAPPSRSARRPERCGRWVGAALTKGSRRAHRGAERRRGYSRARRAAVAFEHSCKLSPT